MADWCILRTNSSRTLSLATSLTAAGIEAWTPIRVELRRVPRRKARQEKITALIPRYVFARAAYLPSLLETYHAHPTFSLFWDEHGPALVSDEQLEPLRTEESRSRPKQRARTYERGEKVCITEGSFAGMKGIVEKDGDHRFTSVSFTRSRPVKIGTYLLRPDCISSPPTALAA
jgi:transcription antitermination factor NusG